MLKILSIIFSTIITSFYFFPFEFVFLPGVNTKMALAGLGLVLLGINLAQGRKAESNKDFLVLSFWGLVVSIIGFAAVTYNNTFDFTYSTYIVSMWVWLSGAYVVTRLIKNVHGNVSIQLVCHYLIAVCVAQCIIAFTMGQYPPLKEFVDSFLASEGFMGKVEGRLYGIGASLDVAGMRFAVVLVIIAYLSLLAKENNNIKMLIYVISFIIIAFAGNMIGRSTTIGVGIAFGIMILISIVRPNSNVKKLWVTMGVVLVFLLPAIVYLYYTNMSVHSNIRFAFEGFFSLYETGKWEVNSNEVLMNMYVFPENAKTWLIGDGYFNNPYKIDPYYTGPNWLGFYMNTDVGYLRFIYYFGILGLLAFTYFMYKAGKGCADRFKSYSYLMWLILIVNYIVWLKVSSDLFLVFALFLCISKEENEEYERLVAESK